MSIIVDLQRGVRLVGIPRKREFQQWVEAALAGQRTQASICIRIVSEKEGLQLNADWRGRDYATNVLSFPCGDLEAFVPGFLGDIVICAAVVGREAAEQCKPLPAHWAHLVIHGVLHLLGFDHQKEDEADKMEALETDVMRRLGYADPYLEFEKL